MPYHVVLAQTSIEKEKTLALLKASSLHMDEHVDETYNLYDGEHIVGTISTYANVIKMIAIDSSYQGEQITALLLHHVMRLFEERQINKYFIYTKPENKVYFTGYPFALVAETAHIALFENKLYTISDHLLALKTTLKPHHGKRAALVMNCNPLTNGHLYLIETCAKENDQVIIFLVEENRSVFPFQVRYQLIKKATKHLKNVSVVPSTPYIISLATFPTYFIKDASQISKQFMELDITIFKQHFFKAFELDSRYVGTEPKDPATRMYNETMQELLGDKLHIIERKTYHDEPISASFIRELMREKNYREIKKRVPSVTYRFLTSKEGRALFQ
ncbi:MAG TPA: GNAT family N-acetyltransferase [Acholeplasmataceae bacterium]|nr:GNAT family N-acetyltransferase [Acholeplasmataceae bacterium]